MNTCNDHDCVVVYDGRNCPLCKAIDELDEANTTISDLESEIAELEFQLGDR